MNNTIHASRIGYLSVGVFLAFLLIVSVAPHNAHAAIVLDSTTNTMLSTTLSATQNLMTTVQADINANMFSSGQSVALSATLGGIGNVLANISAMIGGIGFPNTGYSPLD